ncbi:MAG: hypothetical protein IKJ46_05650 [Tidjanibacter sp.]|nr:hypothetical protein [Tidjanibacter sp.]
MTKKILLPIAIAALLWFVMFSPWTAPHVNFWVTMALSGVVLTGLALWCSPELREQVRKLLGWRNVALGVLSRYDRIEQSDWTSIKNGIKDEMHNYLFGLIKRNPMILPIIMET